jgi:hypothetical protein
MNAITVARTALLVLIAAGCIHILTTAASLPCATELGSCRDAGVLRCGRELGPWDVARPRHSGLPERHSHSACLPARSPTADPLPATTVAIVPQPASVAGDTLLSHAQAASADHQRATITLTVRDVVPDHWVFAMAGGFLDAGETTRCGHLLHPPPVNLGYALIGGNWDARPHGFYFERLGDACVYDGNAPACSGAPSWIPYEFSADESFALDLALDHESDGWWLSATVARADGAGAARVPAIGQMRQQVAAPCWLAPGDPGRALVLVIPHPDPSTATREARVEVARFAWQD